MRTTEDYVQRHYGRAGLADELRDVLARAEPPRAVFDQFHSRADEATAQLARLAGLRRGMRLLDVGSGLGGAARYVASRYHVQVTGIELVREYVRLADVVTARAGLADRISFKHGNAQSAPFPMASFDCVWLQHVLMNVVDKTRLLAELRRVLEPSGRLAIHEVVAADTRELRYPLPWARSPLTHFLPTSERLRTALESAGFTLDTWQDTTGAATAWWRATAASVRAAGGDSTWHTLLGDDAAEMIDNVVDNLRAGRIGIVIAVFTRTP
jgi:SAM-dependent methyltransferase